MYNVRLLSRMNYTLQNSNITNNYCTVNIGYIKYNSQHIKTNIRLVSLPAITMYISLRCWWPILCTYATVVCMYLHLDV